MTSWRKFTTSNGDVVSTERFAGARSRRTFRVFAERVEIRSGPSVAPEQAHHLALHPHPVGPKDPGLIGRIRGFEGD